MLKCKHSPDLHGDCRKAVCKMSFKNRQSQPVNLVFFFFFFYSFFFQIESINSKPFNSLPFICYLILCSCVCVCCLMSHNKYANCIPENHKLVLALNQYGYLHTIGYVYYLLRYISIAQNWRLHYMIAPLESLAKQQTLPSSYWIASMCVRARVMCVCVWEEKKKKLHWEHALPLSWSVQAATRRQISFTMEINNIWYSNVDRFIERILHCMCENEIDIETAMIVNIDLNPTLFPIHLKQTKMFRCFWLPLRFATCPIDARKNVDLQLIYGVVSATTRLWQISFVNHKRCVVSNKITFGEFRSAWRVFFCSSHRSTRRTVSWKQRKENHIRWYLLEYLFFISLGNFKIYFIFHVWNVWNVLKDLDLILNLPNAFFHRLSVCILLCAPVFLWTLHTECPNWEKENAIPFDSNVHIMQCFTQRHIIIHHKT